MKKLLYLTYPIILICLLAIACTKTNNNVQTITPLYKTLEHFDQISPSQQDSIIKHDSIPLSVMFGFLGISEHPDRIELEKWAKSRTVEVFTPLVDSIYPNITNIEAVLGQILAEAEADSLDLPRRRHYAAVVWGNPRSIVMSDSCMLIALNHYLGSDFAGYSHLPDYLRAEKRPAQLPYDICEALLANRYPYRESDGSTVLSRMLYEGAMIVAKMRLLPYNNVAAAMGYSDEQLKWLSANRALIWKDLVAKNLLYSTSKADMEQLVGPAPYTAPLGANVPPRAGRYIGYTIILSYLQSNTNTPLSTLLSPEFYNNPSILIESAYE